ILGEAVDAVRLEREPVKIRDLLASLGVLDHALGRREDFFLGAKVLPSGGLEECVVRHRPPEQVRKARRNLEMIDLQKAVVGRDRHPELDAVEKLRRLEDGTYDSR